MNIKEFKTDIVVIGAGIAGLRAALAASESGASVMIISKGECASPAVIGFNAPVGKDDSEELFFQDTLKSGYDLSDPKLARILVGNAGDVVKEFEASGFYFDRIGDEFDLLQPLGCSCPRLVHQSNHTGAVTMKLMREALRSRRVELFSGITALELLKAEGRICGVLAADAKNNELWLIKAGAVVVANGGGGSIYADSTYPDSHTGDGYGLAFRAGASLIDMEFVQFEPCRCIWPRKLGISTTLLTKGGELRNCNEERFILETHPNGEGTVSKGMLARLVGMEILKGKGSEHDGIYLDLTMLPDEVITRDHAMYYERFMNAGIDLTKERVEVAPVAHTFMGGVKIDSNCGCLVPGLFAAGEVTGGIHGANRIGGSAGTEIYVFGKIAGNSAAEYVKQTGPTEISADLEEQIKTLADRLASGNCNEQLQNAKNEIRSTMAKYAGVVKNVETLTEARSIIDGIAADFRDFKPETMNDLIAFTELKNMLLSAGAVVDASNLRQESRGVHFREDYPELDDRNWRKSIEVIPNASSYSLIYIERG